MKRVHPSGANSQKKRFPQYRVYVEDGILYKRYRNKFTMLECILTAKKLDELTNYSTLYGKGYRIKVLIPSVSDKHEATSAMQLVNAEPVGSSNSDSLIMDVVGAVIEWYESVQRKSWQCDKSLALHGDLNLHNILYQSLERTIYIIDPLPAAHTSNRHIANLDIQHFMMSVALSQRKQYNNFEMMAELYLRSMEPYLLTYMTTHIRLRTHFQLLKLMLVTSVKHGDISAAGSYIIASGFINWFFTARVLKQSMLTCRNVTKRFFRFPHVQS
jgi:tRNA A-37 threonylcarbamoyl transferase component Bud32